MKQIPITRQGYETLKKELQKLKTVERPLTINAIEEALPDALKQLSDTLKAGGTYEYALREIATSEYDYLSKEMKNVIIHRIFIFQISLLT